MNLLNIHNVGKLIWFMDTFDAVRERRSVKHYDPNHKLSDEDIEKLMSLAYLRTNSIEVPNF